jgi:diguanylate cyclase (GGDEF)-like protein
VLAGMAAAMADVSSLFEIDLGTAEEIGSILDEAQETLLMVSLGTSRQVDTAREAIDSLSAKAKALEEKSQRDPLTGLHNRAGLDAFITNEVQQSAHSGKPLSVIMADIDHFKQVNDGHGHPAGDKVLASVSSCLKTRLRPRDMVARYGGEEFILVLPETDAAGATVVAERIRKNVEDLAHEISPGKALRITISLGCATSTHETPFTSRQELIEAADRSLYVAKREGRNRVVAFATLAARGEAGPPGENKTAASTASR